RKPGEKEQRVYPQITPIRNSSKESRKKGICFLKTTLISRMGRARKGWMYPFSALGLGSSARNVTWW
ncbi:MAG: hypothetical protein ACRDGM_12565, partial [bacterium]